MNRFFATARANPSAHMPTHISLKAYCTEVAKRHDEKCQWADFAIAVPYFAGVPTLYINDWAKSTTFLRGAVLHTEHHTRMKLKHKLKQKWKEGGRYTTAGTSKLTQKAYVYAVLQTEHHTRMKLTHKLKQKWKERSRSTPVGARKLVLILYEHIFKFPRATTRILLDDRIEKR